MTAPSSTFYTASPEWQWLVILYFFVGGLAGGCYFLAVLLDLFGTWADRRLARVGYYVALPAVLLSGILLIADLRRPTRFWHMLLESETLRPMFKAWSPISFGAWGLTGFGLCAFLAALGAAYEDGRLRWRPLRLLAVTPVATAVAVLGAVFGFFLAGYTGVLLTVTNRPIWADSNWLGALFVCSAASTGAAALILLAAWRRVAHPASLAWLARFDEGALILELLVLVAFLVALGRVAQVYVGWWGLLLLVGVVLFGILVPLGLGYGVRMPGLARVRNAPVTAAALVLVGGLLLRVVVILSSETIRVAGNRVVGP
jgi:formate-dependent nitrite reductase membrane component NrfD